MSKFAPPTSINLRIKNAKEYIDIRMQLHQNLKTTIPRCQHNYTIKKQADNRTLNSYCQPIVSFYCQHVLYCNSLL